MIEIFSKENASIKSPKQIGNDGEGTLILISLPIAHGARMTRILAK